MPVRRIQCAIEQIADWHAHLFVEPHVVAFVGVASQYSDSPATFEVQSEGFDAHRLAGGNRRLDVSWQKDTSEKKAERLRATMQPGSLVELAAIALAFVLSRRLLMMDDLDVTAYGDRADYRSRKRKTVLEVSGTQNAVELGRRHREKVAQALDNPFGWKSCVVVCAFSDAGHRIRLSSHTPKEAPNAEY